MKKTMFALAAMMVAGLASAVSTNWKDYTATSAPTTNASFTIATVFTVGDVATFKGAENYLLGASYLTNVQSSGLHTGPMFGLYTNGEVHGKSQTLSGGLTRSGNGAASDFGTLSGDYFGIKAGENAVALTVTIDGGTFTYGLFINGKQVLTGTHTDVGATVRSLPNLHFVEANDNVTKVSNYYMNSIASSSDIASLPEPTVLALLALGVAGVALKRKVA